MPTYDPKSVTITIGGQRFEGFTEVEYGDRPSQSVVGADGRVKGRTIGSTRGRFETSGSVTLTGPEMDDLATALGLARYEPQSDARTAYATRAEVEAAGVRAVVPDASSDLISAAIETARAEARARLNPIMSLGDAPESIVAALAAASLLERAGFASDSPRAQAVREMRRRANESLRAIASNAAAGFGMADWSSASEMHGLPWSVAVPVDPVAEARRRRIAKLRASLAALIAEPYPPLP